MAVSFSVRLYSRAVTSRTICLQRRARLRPLTQRLLTISAAQLKDTGQAADPSNNTGELFQATDVLSDISSGASSITTTAATDVSIAASTAPEVVDLASLGLGGYWPSGLIQTALELMHNHTHLPWWVCIVSLTVALRLMMLPVGVKMQRFGAKMANINKEVRPYHQKIQECKAAGDKTGEAQAGMEILKIYQTHKVHPFEMFPLAFAQVPVFLSMLYGLRGMAGLPLESFRTGGMLWFTDLVVPDPMYCLPLIACGSFLINIELGGEGGATTDNELSTRVRWIMRIGAICILPVTIQFPSAVLLYWVSNSMFSTVQILFFKLPVVKKFFKIPILKRNTDTTSQV